MLHLDEGCPWAGQDWAASALVARWWHELKAGRPAPGWLEAPAALGEGLRALDGMDAQHRARVAAEMRQAAAGR